MPEVSPYDSGIYILMSKEDRHEIVKLLKKVNQVVTLHSLSIKSQKLFDRIYNAFDLKEEIVKNVMAYVKCLPKPGTEVIDKNIFDAQMKRHFNLTDVVLLERMYQVCRLDDKSTKVYMDEFVELICIFLTSIRDLKVQFVFRVYNAREDGYLNRKDLEYFIKPMVAQVSALDEHEEESEESTGRFFVELLVNICDKNGDDQVELDEFRGLAEQNVLMMECLGPCLPSEEDRLTFKKLLTDKTNIECGALFRFERRISLREPALVEIKGIQRFYPVDLELP